MTVTLSAAELDKFAAKVSDWRSRRYEFVVTNLIQTGQLGRPEMHFRQDLSIYIQKLYRDFEKEAGPEPNWRMLLE